ncbi:MAG TPA: hypothetical protein VIW46_10240 [Acidimicrobiia bacterium]
MDSDKDILERVTLRLRRAIENETGTSFDAEEVKLVGQLLHAFGRVISEAGGGGREACVICGRATHPDMAIDEYPRHVYEPGILVPKVGPA